MRGQRRRVSPALIVAGILVASVVGCNATATPPSGTVAAGASVDATGPPQLSDVVAYRGGFARTGQMPGPRPEGTPVELWSYDSAAGYEAQPLIVGGLVIAISLEGEVAAIDGSTGARRDVLRLPAGVSATPAISGDTLFVVTRDSELRAVALAGLTEMWHRPGYDADASPAIAEDLVLAGAKNGALVARHSSDGTEAWTVPAPAAARVAVEGDLVVTSGDGSGEVTWIDLGGDKTSVSKPTGGADTLTPALVDGNVYVAHRDVIGGSNGVDAFDATREPLWRFEEPDGLRIEGIGVDGDIVYVHTEVPARVHALDRATGDLRWSEDVHVASLGGGAIADGLLYVVGSPDALSAIDLSTGQTAWTVPLEVTAEPSPLVVSGGLVIVAVTVDGRGRIVAFAGPSDPRGRAASSPGPTPGEPSVSAEASPEPAGVRQVADHDVESEADLIGGTVGPDGTLYVPDVANHRILVLDPSGNQRWWGEPGTGEGQFDFSAVTQNDAPAGVGVSPDGKLIAVGEGGNHRIQLFDRNLKHIGFIGRTGRGDGQFVNPCCVTIDGDHRIWVVDAGRGDVQVFDETGSFLRKFPSDDSADHQLSRPGGVFVREDADEVLVADFDNQRVAVFSKDGSWLRSYGSNSKEHFYLGEVNMAMPGPDGRVLILDTSNRIFALDAAGSLLGTLALDDAFGRIDSSGVAITPTGRLFVVDRDRDRIVEGQLEPPIWPAN
jgi:outer membrane protein assembly factor BamB